jgi:hypothetical protein
MVGRYPTETFAEAPVEALHQKEERKLALDKNDDAKIPAFAQDVAVSSKKKVAGETVTVDFSWKEPTAASEIDSTHVSHLVFRNGEGLENFSKLTVRDGYDSVSVKYNRITYFLRKTSEDVARALYNAAGKISGGIENVIGYLSTVLGNFYVISRIDKGTWTFDSKMANEQVGLVEVNDFDAEHKEKLAELATEQLRALHKQRLVLGKFSLSNMLLTANSLIFTDLRKLRVSRKSSLFVDEFISALRYLVQNGIATKADATHAVMAYSVDMEDACNCWYRERHGKSATDAMTVVEEMEKELA